MSNSAVSKGKKRKSDSGAEVWFILLFNCILFYSKTLEGLPFALNFSSYHILIVTYSHFTFHIIDIKYHNKHQIPSFLPLIGIALFFATIVIIANILLSMVFYLLEGQREC
jgi:hypothetical protein